MGAFKVKNKEFYGSIALKNQSIKGYNPKLKTNT
jgi:hypothetical protein